MTTEKPSDGDERTRKVRRVTIRDVARLSGTSISTVSAAFTGSVRVAEETKKSIYDAANRLGWRPDRRASHLRRNESVLVGVVSELDQSFQNALVDALYQARHGFELEIFLVAATTHNSEIDAVRLLLAERCSAIILTGANLTDEQFAAVARSVPTLSLCRPVTAPGVDTVLSDSRQGMRLAVDHLEQAGHSRIAHASGGSAPATAQRRTAYESAMASAGLKETIQVLQGGDTVAAGIVTADALLGMERPPTAVICYNDMAANGLVRRLQQNGVRVPEDISVVGYDDAPIASDPIVSLTTIAQPIAQMAGDALAGLTARIASGMLVGAGQEQHITRPTELIVRGSSGVPPQTP